jgi:outer membrane usher protein
MPKLALIWVSPSGQASQGPRDIVGRLALFAVLLLGTPPVVAQAAAPEQILLGVRLNGQDLGIARLLRAGGAGLFARRADLQAWRLRVPPEDALLYRGEEYFSLGAFQGSEFQVNTVLQEVSLQIPPQYFDMTRLDSMPARMAVPSAPGSGGFGNYDLYYTLQSGARTLSAQMEAGLFNRLGVGVSTFTVQRDQDGVRAKRLDSSWTHDLPGQAMTFVVGDTAGASGIWGRPVRFGGLRYGSNFSTQPGFVAYPLPGLKGEAALPTTAELYINGILHQRSEVPPGPFSISNVPVVSGQGDLRLVVRDLLGREQVLNVPYYASGALLRQGLTDESSELGWVRRNYASESANYGPLAATLQRRYGFCDEFTGEGRLELLGRQQTAGLGGSLVLGDAGVLTGAGALSLASGQWGGLAQIALEHHAQRGLSGSFQGQWTTPNFVQLGQQPNQPALLRSISASVTAAAGHWGSFSLSYNRQDSRSQPPVRIASMGYGVGLDRFTSLSISSFRTLVGPRSQAISLLLVTSFGERSSASADVTIQPGASQTTLQAQQNLAAGSGTGYDVRAGRGAQGVRAEGSLAWQNEVGTYLVGAARNDRQNAFRASASGGLGILEGNAFLSRRIDNSFGLAQAPGFAGVGIYVDNQLTARTDAQGLAVLPRLLPYQRNTVRLDLADLPMDAQIEGDHVEAVPYYRSGVLVHFEVRRTRAVLVVLKLDDGESMPVGSVVMIEGGDVEFPVAQRGEVYLIGLAEQTRLRASWRGQECEFMLSLPSGAATPSRLGPIACRGVQR